MIYYEHAIKYESIIKNNIIPIYRINSDDKEVFEGWAKLIKKSGELNTFIPEDEEVYGTERWLIQWVSIESLDDTHLTPETRISQSILAGKKCHRPILCFIGYWFQLVKRSQKSSLPKGIAKALGLYKTDYVRKFSLIKEEFSGAF